MRRRSRASSDEQPPIGFRIGFSEDQITITKVTEKDSALMLEGASVSKRMYVLLDERGVPSRRLPDNDALTSILQRNFQEWLDWKRIGKWADRYANVVGGHRT